MKKGRVNIMPKVKCAWITCKNNIERECMSDSIVLKHKFDLVDSGERALEHLDCETYEKSKHGKQRGLNYSE